MPKKTLKTFMINIFFPCFILSGLVGIITGVVTFFFKYVASFLITQSRKLYLEVRVNLIFLPVFYLALFLLAFISYSIIKRCKCAKGGGIPTSIGILRGVITFKWLKNLIGTIVSAFSSYFAGISLGEEGQCVQIGTCIGKGVAHITKDKKRAWERYVMTGGASAGFAVATGAPISGVFFSLEEAHKRFSPMIIMVALSSTIFGYATSLLLGKFTNLYGNEMVFKELDILAIDIKYFYIFIIIGLIVGLIAIATTHLFKAINKIWNDKLSNIKLFVKVIIVFFLSGTIGLILPDSLGGGINLINLVSQRKIVISMILVFLVIKTFLSLFSNTTGVTGGLFIPTLCQGCLLGGALGEAFLWLGFNEELYLPIVVVAMTSYLAAVQRTPITAIIFSVEIFSGLNNILFILIAVFLSYMIIEMFNLTSLNDISLGERLKADNKGRKKVFIDSTVEVQPSSFVIGKMVRDVFWPADCQVLSISYNNKSAPPKDGDKHIHEGDLLHLRYHKYDDENDDTYEILTSILGKQEFKETKKTR